jgi:hypothetical protein
LQQRAKKLFGSTDVPEMDIEMDVEPVARVGAAAAPPAGGTEGGVDGIEEKLLWAPDGKVSDQREVPHDYPGMEYYIMKAEVLVKPPRWVAGNRASGELLDLKEVTSQMELALTYKDTPQGRKAMLHGYPRPGERVGSPEGFPLADMFTKQICSSEVQPTRSGVDNTQNMMRGSPCG